MPLDSWTTPEETPALAAHASAMIDAALTGTALASDTFWAAVRKGYNTPYNDPPPRRAAAPAPVVSIAVEPLPVAVMAAATAAEIRPA